MGITAGPVSPTYRHGVALKGNSEVTQSWPGGRNAANSSVTRSDESVK